MAKHGSVLTEEMTVEVDAMIMDGSTLESGVYTLHVCSPELNLITKSFTSLFLLLLLFFMIIIIAVVVLSQFCSPNRMHNFYCSNKNPKIFFGKRRTSSMQATL